VGKAQESSATVPQGENEKNEANWETLGERKAVARKLVRDVKRVKKKNKTDEAQKDVPGPL